MPIGISPRSAILDSDPDEEGDLSMAGAHKKSRARDDDPGGGPDRARLKIELVTALLSFATTALVLLSYLLSLHH